MILKSGLRLWGIEAGDGGQGSAGSHCCRYVEVFEANPLDVERAKDQEEGGGRGGGGRDRGRRSGHTVQLRGLPFRASEREIADWLSEAADPDEVIIVMDRLVRVIMMDIGVYNNPLYFRTGRPSGQADAIFRDERDARYALNAQPCFDVRVEVS